MNQKEKGIILIGLCFFLIASILPAVPVVAYGDTALKTGQRLVYDVSVERTQQWTINGTWYNTTNPAIRHFTLFNESRTRTIFGSITVDILEVRLYTVDLRISYDLNSRQQFWDSFLNDSTPANDYTGTYNTTRDPDGPHINTTLYTTWFWNQTDSFELEVNKLTLAIGLMTKYNASVALTSTFYSLVTTSPVDYCSFWIYPDAKSGETYKFSHLGLLFEMTGDYDGWSPAATQAPLSYEIEGSRIYSAPSSGIGDAQWVHVANYEIQPDKSTTHTHTRDLDNYVNEFLFDKDTGILLQYHRAYRILPYAIIGEFTSPTTPISPTGDLYNLDFKMTLRQGSIVELGLSNTDVILLWVFIPVGIIAVIVVIFFIRRRH